MDDSYPVRGVAYARTQVGEHDWAQAALVAIGDASSRARVLITARSQTAGLQMFCNHTSATLPTNRLSIPSHPVVYRPCLTLLPVSEDDYAQPMLWYRP
jgi:hypothetical protein